MSRSNDDADEKDVEFKTRFLSAISKKGQVYINRNFKPLVIAKKSGSQSKVPSRKITHRKSGSSK